MLLMCIVVIRSLHYYWHYFRFFEVRVNLTTIHNVYFVRVFLPILQYCLRCAIRHLRYCLHYLGGYFSHSSPLFRNNGNST